MKIKEIRSTKLFNALFGALLLSGAPSIGFAQQYIFAPTSAFAIDGWVAGWLSNRPPGTLTQDWYPGSGEPSTGGTPVMGDTHDTTFLSSTGSQQFGGGLTAIPDPTFLDFQVISGLSASNVNDAITAQQYVQFPFTTGTMFYADSTASEALFYVNAAITLKRWNLNSNSHPRAFGYAAYIVDASGNPVGGLIQQVDDVSTVTGEDYQIVRAPDGPGPGITLQPGTSYALRFYLYRTAANADGRASWDDTMFTMSRQALAEIVVTASPISTTPAGAQNNYSYTFNVYNNGPDATTATITDPLPGTANGASATWSCTLQPSGNPCATPTGTGAINTIEPLTSGETAVYTVSWTGPGVTVPDTHTISAQPTTGSPTDPISTNNAAAVSLTPPTITANDDSVILPTNTSSASTPVTSNDNGTGGAVDPDSVTVATPPSVGTVACSAGLCTYTPPASGLTTPVTYQYNVCLEAPNQTICTTATVTVVPPSRPPAPVPLMGWLSLAGLASLLGTFGLIRSRRRTLA